MQLGRLDVDRMLGEITPELFDEWRAFATLRPFGNHKLAEMLATLIAATQAAAGAEACDVPGVLRAWGFDVPEEVITEADVMSEEETEAAVKAAFGIG